MQPGLFQPAVLYTTPVRIQTASVAHDSCLSWSHGDIRVSRPCGAMTSSRTEQWANEFSLYFHSLICSVEALSLFIEISFTRNRRKSWWSFCSSLLKFVNDAIGRMATDSYCVDIYSDSTFSNLKFTDAVIFLIEDPDNFQVLLRLLNNCVSTSEMLLHYRSAGSAWSQAILRSWKKGVGRSGWILLFDQLYLTSWSFVRENISCAVIGWLSDHTFCIPTRECNTGNQYALSRRWIKLSTITCFKIVDEYIHSQRQHKLRCQSNNTERLDATMALRQTTLSFNR